MHFFPVITPMKCVVHIALHTIPSELLRNFMDSHCGRFKSYRVRR